MDQLLALLGNAVHFAYSCWDRIVLNGYLERLQRSENLVYFFHEVVGVKCIEPAVLEQRTNAYKAWVRRFTDEHGIAVLQAPPAPPKGVRKEHFVQPFYRRLKGGEGIACVLPAWSRAAPSCPIPRVGRQPAATRSTASSRRAANASCITTGMCWTQSWDQ